MSNTKAKTAARKKRHMSVRKKIRGTAERPRLNVFRSAKHIYAQLIDDNAGETLAAASTMEPALNIENGGNKEAARQIGATIAQRATEKGHETVVFDRGGFVYHGRVQELADAARENGLKF
ncbi:large subunit ribosomal protein L18 [Salsuginibacillus halophilus]|uniref:Large ribosomal subunit protein uL18 n=1 Tax=Salsuginibacillus halophilus TaxID=517424 RepID=A0A2P8H8I2_9BACI|nr:50S ribosomal protein L18 [Salsuginibacillus halophilus]PSL42543.1 large subunit ribosomal protein L18 [Salsuginibacillus halophilus]